MNENIEKLRLTWTRKKIHRGAKVAPAHPVKSSCCARLYLTANKTKERKKRQDQII